MARVAGIQFVTNEISATILHGKKLPLSMVNLWSNLFNRLCHKTPFLHPRFATIVANHWPDAHVVVFRDKHHSCCGFLPIDQIDRTAYPMLRTMSDWQGLVAVSERAEWLIPALRATGIGRIEYDHLLVQPCTLENLRGRIDESPIIVLNDGLQAYEEELAAKGSRLMADMRRKTRRLWREIGKITFEPFSLDMSALEW